MDQLIAENQAREERTRSKAMNLVRRWLDHAPAYEPTHPARDAQRHEALWDHRSHVEPEVHALDIDDALDGLTKVWRHRIQMFDHHWPAPFPPIMGSGFISFEDRTLREFDRFAADPDAPVPRHLDALYRSTLSGHRTSMEALRIHYFGSVYRSGDRVYVVWVEAWSAVVYG
jgi:hypothetical protein